MKQYLAALLALLLMFSLSSCFKPDGEADTPAPGPTESETPPADDPPAEPSDDPDDLSVGESSDTLTIILEGETQTVPAARYNSWLGYSMTYDRETFTLNLVDTLSNSYMAEVVEGRPNVYLAISILEDLTFDEAVEGMRLQRGIEEDAVTVAIGRHAYAASYLRYAAGTESNDEVVEYYLTEQNDTIFLIALGNFVGGEEGFGARLHAMLDTITF